MFSTTEFVMNRTLTVYKNNKLHWKVCFTYKI